MFEYKATSGQVRDVWVVLLQLLAPVEVQYPFGYKRLGIRVILVSP